MARHDQRAAKGDHHQDAEQRAEHGHQRDARDFQVEAEDEDRGHGDPEAEGDRLARRAGGLHDVVLEDGGIAHAGLRREAEKRDGDHRHGNGGADRQPDLENQIERRGAEHHAEERAHDHRAQGEFVEAGAVGDEGPMRKSGDAVHSFSPFWAAGPRSRATDGAYYRTYGSATKVPARRRPPPPYI